jgi:DNA invertase Pin-like site-specific DNA recombinase
MKVVTYLRAGTRHLAPVSLAHQEQRLGAYAATHGHRIVGTFANMGFAGAGLWAALELLARGEAEALLVNDGTHLLRAHPDALAPLRALLELNATLLAATTGTIDPLSVGRRPASHE